MDPVEAWSYLPVGVDHGDLDMVAGAEPLVCPELRQLQALPHCDSGVGVLMGVSTGYMDGLDDPDRVGNFPIKAFEFFFLQCLTVGDLAAARPCNYTV